LGEEGRHHLCGPAFRTRSGHTHEGIEQGGPGLAEATGAVLKQRPRHRPGRPSLVQIDALFVCPLLNEEIDDFADGDVWLVGHDNVDAASESAARRQGIRERLRSTSTTEVLELNLLGLPRFRTSTQIRQEL
jgi:hypothetical protein